MVSREAKPSAIPSLHIHSEVRIDSVQSISLDNMQRKNMAASRNLFCPLQGDFQRFRFTRNGFDGPSLVRRQAATVEGNDDFLRHIAVACHHERSYRVAVRFDFLEDRRDLHTIWIPIAAMVAT